MDNLGLSQCGANANRDFWHQKQIDPAEDQVEDRQRWHLGFSRIANRILPNAVTQISFGVL